MQDLIKLIKEISDTYKMVSLKKPIEVLDNLLEKSPFIDIAIIGQFKAGKSSFTNSLLGRQILPVGVIPVTTIITRLVYGEKEKAIVKYSDGIEKEISINETEDYVSELKNPVNEKKVDYVEIQLPELKEYKNLRLIDTPGVGSILKHNTDMTEGWLPNAGISIMLVNSGVPLSDNDFQMIRDALEICPDITIVLSKVDLLSEGQLKEVSDYTGRALKKEFNRTFAVMNYSIYAGRENYNSEIINKVLLPIVNNFDREFNNILHHKAESLRKSCIAYLEIALKAAEYNETAREILKKQVLDEELNSVYINNDLRIVIRNHKSLIREQNREELLGKYFNNGDKTSNVSIRIEKDFDINFGQQKGNLYKYSRTFEQWLNDRLESELSNVMTKETERLNKIIDDERKNITYYIESIRKKLNDNLKRLLNTELPEIDLELKTELVKKPNISVYWAFDSNIDSLWFLIPMPLFRKAFRRYFRFKIEPETEKNLTRLASLFSNETDKIIDNMYKQVIDYLGNELGTIEKMLSGGNSNIEEQKRLIEELKVKKFLLITRINKIVDS